MLYLMLLYPISFYLDLVYILLHCILYCSISIMSSLPPSILLFSPLRLLFLLYLPFLSDTQSPSFSSPRTLVHPSPIPLMTYTRKETIPKDKNSSSKLRNQLGLKSYKVQELERNFNYLVTGDRIKQYETSVLASYASYGLPDKKQVRTCECTSHLQIRLPVLVMVTGCMVNSTILFQYHCIPVLCCVILCCAVLCCAVYCCRCLSAA
jgi:hypothetical protein